MINNLNEITFKDLSLELFKISKKIKYITLDYNGIKGWIKKPFFDIKEGWRRTDETPSITIKEPNIDFSEYENSGVVDYKLCLIYIDELKEIVKF